MRTETDSSSGISYMQSGHLPGCTGGSGGIGVPIKEDYTNLLH